MTKKISYILLVATLFFLFLFASVLFVDNFLYLKDQKTFINQRIQPHRPSVDGIKPWMTVSYLNRAFDLPPTYLQNILKINDRKYPRITLAKISSIQEKTTEDIITTVKKSIELYQASTQKTSP